MKQRFLIFATIAIGVSTDASLVRELHAGSVRSVLPPSANAKALLSATTRHREWVNIGTDSAQTLVFVVYPERSDKAPALLVTAKDQSSTPLLRAVADQLAGEGFVSIVPEVPAGLDTVDRYARTVPPANATTAWLDIDFGR